jgi:site-specific recombinase XerD
MGRRKKKGKHSRAKTILRLPDLEQSRNAVLNSLAAASSQESYAHAIDEFIGWYCSAPRLAFNRSVVLRYRFFLEQKNLAPSTINVRLAAVRRLALEAADTGLLSPELAAGIGRVKGAKRLGVRIGNWLTVEQSRTILAEPQENSLRGKRDRAILALLIGCGLRRAELEGVGRWFYHRSEILFELLGFKELSPRCRRSSLLQHLKRYLPEPRGRRYNPNFGAGLRKELIERSQFMLWTGELIKVNECSWTDVGF